MRARYLFAPREDDELDLAAAHHRSDVAETLQEPRFHRLEHGRRVQARLHPRHVGGEAAHDVAVQRANPARRVAFHDELLAPQWNVAERLPVTRDTAAGVAGGDANHLETIAATEAERREQRGYVGATGGRASREGVRVPTQVAHLRGVTRVPGADQPRNPCDPPEFAG